MNSKQFKSIPYDKAQASQTTNKERSETTNKDARVDMEGAEDQLALRSGIMPRQRAVQGQGHLNQDTHGTQSRSSRQVREQRHQIINNHLLATTSRTNSSFEEKNFQNNHSLEDAELQSQGGLGSIVRPTTNINENQINNYSAPNHEADELDDDLQLDGNRQSAQVAEPQDLHDLSRSLVNSYMLNERNLRDIIHERIKSFQQQTNSDQKVQKEDPQLGGADQAEQNAEAKDKFGKPHSCADTWTFSSSEKIYVLNRFNDLQFWK